MGLCFLNFKQSEKPPSLGLQSPGFGQLSQPLSLCVMKNEVKPQFSHLGRGGHGDVKYTVMRAVLETILSEGQCLCLSHLSAAGPRSSVDACIVYCQVTNQPKLAVLKQPTVSTCDSEIWELLSRRALACSLL